MTTTGLSLSSPGHGELNLGQNDDAPRLLQPITGNFTIETHLQFRPTKNWQSAGILLWQDMNNYIRFERVFGFAYTNHPPKSGIFVQQWDHGQGPKNIAGVDQHLTTAGSVILRVQKQGDHFTFSWQVPGQGLQPGGSTDLHFDKLMVGVDPVTDYAASSNMASYRSFSVSCM